MASADHYHASRFSRLPLMDDREIAEAARCYRCGGHHVERFPRMPLVPVRLAIGVGFIAAVIAALASF